MGLEVPGNSVHILREFANYRHPGPRRVWKGGSDLQGMTPLPLDPVDPVDPLNEPPLQKGLSNLVRRRST